MNTLSLAKRLAALESRADRLPDQPPGPPHPLWLALEADPEVLAANRTIQEETGINPRTANHQENRIIWDAALTNEAVAKAQGVFSRRLFELMAEHCPPGVRLPSAPGGITYTNAR